MPSQNIMSLAVGRLAGQSAGVPDEDLGKLSIVSYFVGNPILAIVAARSMAPKEDIEPKPKPVDPVDEAKAAAAAAKVAAATAGAAVINAEKAAKDAAGSASAAATSDTNAKASAEEAKAAAKASGTTTKI